MKNHGWKFVVNIPPLKKCVICVAPHTSNWDFIMGELAIHSVGMKAGFLMKDTWFFFPVGQLMKALGHPELAVILLKGRPALVYSGKGEEKAILDTLRPLMAARPRGQQLTRVIVTDTPLPRTATGKIKRWELQQEMETL